MTKYLAVILIVAFLAGCSSQNSQQEQAVSGITPGQVDIETDSLNNNGQNPNPGQSVDYSKMEPSLSQEVLLQKYFEATEKDVKTSLIGKHKFAMFFHADWCPTCQNIETEIQEGLSQLSEDTKIAKVNYDTETVLKQEFGITTQSTVVVFEKSGKINEVLVSPNLEQITTSLSESK